VISACAHCLDERALLELGGDMVCVSCYDRAHGLGEARCDVCNVVDEFVPVDGRIALAERVCRACDDAITAEEHESDADECESDDSGPCTCSSCERFNERARRAPLRVIAGGLSPEGMSALGWED
jgi:hypothetical protein